MKPDFQSNCEMAHERGSMKPLKATRVFLSRDNRVPQTSEGNALPVARAVDRLPPLKSIVNIFVAYDLELSRNRARRVETELARQLAPEAVRPQIVAGQSGVSEIVGETFINYVAPKGTVARSNRPAPRAPTLPPLGGGTLPAPIYINRVNFPVRVNLRHPGVRKIHWRFPLLLRPRVAPLHTVIPVHIIHRMIRCCPAGAFVELWKL